MAEEDIREEETEDEAPQPRRVTDTGWPDGDRWASTGAIHPVQAFDHAAVADYAGSDEEPELFNLEGVEIFRVGTWNGDKYTRDDLDEMIRNFGRVGFRPPVKLGHAEASGAPASGWVEKIWRVGDRLLANFMDLPRDVFAAVKARRFDAVSAEIFWNLKRAGQTFKRALKAVALLGAETPAVAGLKPLRENFSDEDLLAVHIYATPEHVAQREGETMGENATLKELQEQLATLRAEKEALEAKVSSNGEDAAAAVRIEALQEELAEMRAANQRIAEDRRKELIRVKCERVKVPAFRPHFLSLYDLASRAKYASDETVRTVRFASGDDGKVEDVDPVEVVDDLANRINERVESLLLSEQTSYTSPEDRMAALGRHGEPDTSGDVGDQVDDLARAYMSEHNMDGSAKDYQRAVDAVLSDPKHRALKLAYVGRGRVQ